MELRCCLRGGTAALCNMECKAPDGHVRAQALARQFPGSEWVAAAAAGAQYNLRNFDEAQELFEDLLERDPHRIEARACGCPQSSSPK